MQRLNSVKLVLIVFSLAVFMTTFYQTTSIAQTKSANPCTRANVSQISDGLYNFVYDTEEVPLRSNLIKLTRCVRNLGKTDMFVGIERLFINGYVGPKSSINDTMISTITINKNAKEQFSMALIYGTARKRTQAFFETNGGELNSSSGALTQDNDATHFYAEPLESEFQTTIPSIVFKNKVKPPITLRIRLLSGLFQLGIDSWVSVSAWQSNPPLNELGWSLEWEDYTYNSSLRNPQSKFLNYPKTGSSAEAYNRLLFALQNRVDTNELLSIMSMFPSRLWNRTQARVYEYMSSRFRILNGENLVVAHSESTTYAGVR